MTEIAINRVRARMRLPREAMREQARIKRIISAALARELESAIDRRAIARDGYLCISSLHTQLMLRLEESDAVLAASVGRALGDAIAGAIRGACGIYYSSRAHVLADLITSVMRGDFERAWAWSQLGLWQDLGTPSARSCANQALGVLSREARHAVAIISEVARDGSTLAALMRWADPRLWLELARAASRAHGRGLDPEQIFRGEALSPQASEVALGLLEQSRIAPDLVTGARGRLPDRTIDACAIMVMLEVEPAAIHAGTESVCAVLRSIAMLVRRSAERGTLIKATPDLSQVPSPVEEGRAIDRLDALPGEARTSAADRASDYSRRDPDSPREAEHAAAEVRRSAATKAGGLTYLINAVARNDLPLRIMRDHRLSTRGLRWSLHQLGTALLALDPADAALLAFAGLLPDASPPNLRAEPLRDEELAAIEDYRAVLIAYLRRSLGDRLAPAGISDDALVDFVCRRRARIMGDPGWLEIHFPVDEAAPEIRFAGLDLDPGWIPWLGVVVKFIYA